MSKRYRKFDAALFAAFVFIGLMVWFVAGCRVEVPF